VVTLRGKLLKRLPSFISTFLSGHYRKNLVAFLLLASLPGIIFGIVLFLVSKSQMEKELQEVHQNHLYNTIDTIEEQFSYVELLLAHWVSDSNFSDNYENINVVNDYSKVHKIYKTLLTMEGSNPLIGRVELFLNEPNPIVFSKNGYTFLEAKENQDKYAKFLSHDKTLFWKHSLSSIEKGYENRFASLGLIHKLPIGSFHSYGSLMVFLDEEHLVDLLKSPYEEGSVFLLRDQDNWIFGDKEQTDPTTLQQAILDEITMNPTSTEPFLFQWDNITYTVTYDYFSRLGEEWYYVSVAPLSTITAPVVFISKLFIILSLIIFILAILLSMFASKKLYAPIGNLMDKINGDKLIYDKNEFELIETQWNHLSSKSEALQQRLESQLPHLQEGFLLQLIQGYLYSYQENELRERMQHFGWETAEDKYVVLFIQMFGFSKLKGDFSEGDEGLVTFSAVNIAEELLETLGMEAADVINFHDLSLGILLTFSKDLPAEEIDTKVMKLSENMITFINEICHLDVSIGISRKIDSIKAIHRNFEEVKSALSFRNLHEKNQIIEIEKVDRLTQNHDTFEYPFDLEKQITHAIRLRNEEEAIKLIQLFFTMLSKENVSGAMMKQGALQLLGSIFHIVLQAGMMDDFVNEGNHLYEQLYDLKDLEEIRQWFEFKVISPIIQELSQKQDQRLRLIAEKVVHLLQENYMNDISLDYCADEVNLNPSILSKVFKEITGWNFIDYLTNIRLSKAKELLIETDTKIKNIAETIGYKHSYFNRLFKKHESLTPSEFRDINRKNIV
jgi:AraC-like DNA-binding protein